MTAKEEAKELYYKFTCVAPLHSDNKECALIAVDEILELLYFLSDCSQNLVDKRDYYEEIKQEIEKL